MSPTQYIPSIAARLCGYEVDFQHHRCTLWLADGEQAFMPGAISFAERRDEQVKRIVTMSGDQPSTIFEKHGDGWTASGPITLKGEKRNAEANTPAAHRCR